METREEKAWRLLLQNAMKLPKIQLDRASWYTKVLSPYVSEQTLGRALTTSPARAGIEHPTLSQVAQATLRAHRRGVTTLSLVTGLPGGVALAGALPADLAQFLWHLIQVAQKLTALYGWPPLFVSPKSLTADETLLLTVFLAQMFGSERADKLLQEIQQSYRDESGPLPRDPIASYHLKEEAQYMYEWMGINAAREGLTKTLARVVPVLGGLLSGGLSYLAFTKMGQRLHTLLKRAPL